MAQASPTTCAHNAPGQVLVPVQPIPCRQCGALIEPTPRAVAIVFERDSITMGGTVSSGTFTASWAWNGATYTSTAIQWNSTAVLAQAILLAATRTGSVAFSQDAGVNAITVTGGALPGTPLAVQFAMLGAVSAQATVSSLGGSSPTVTFAQTVRGGVPALPQPQTQVDALYPGDGAAASATWAFAQ